MQLAVQIVVLTHLVGFAALLGGGLVQLRDPDPEINAAMLHGSWVSLLSGVGLWVLGGAAGDSTPTWVLVVKTVITAFVTLLVVRNRRYLSIPRGLLVVITTAVLVVAALSVLGR